MKGKYEEKDFCEHDILSVDTFESGEIELFLHNSGSPEMLRCDSNLHYDATDNLFQTIEQKSRYETPTSSSSSHKISSLLLMLSS